MRVRAPYQHDVSFAKGSSSLSRTEVPVFFHALRNPCFQLVVSSQDYPIGYLSGVTCRSFLHPL